MPKISIASTADDTADTTSLRETSRSTSRSSVNPVRKIEPVFATTATLQPPKRQYRFDALNMSLAGLRDGAGPILALYLVRDVHLDPVSLSWVMAAPGIASMCVQTPIGFIYDRLSNKRLPLMAGAILMGIACLLMSRSTHLYSLLILQLMVGTSTCLMGLGIPALSLATAGPDGLAKRLARNEIFGKIGNFSTLGVIGYLTQTFSLRWVFYIVPLLSIPVAILARKIPFREPEIHPEPEKSVSILSTLKSAVKTPGLLLLAFVTLLFEFADAPQLMIFEQSFAKSAANGGSAVIASALVVTQITISLTIIGLSRIPLHPIRIIIAGFALTALRSAIFVTDFGIPGLYAAQILDGMIAAIALTVPMRLIAQTNSRHFNVLSGLLGSCVSLGATIATLLAGYLIAGFNYRTAFGFFGIAAVLGFGVAFSARALFENASKRPGNRTGQTTTA